MRIFRNLFVRLWLVRRLLGTHQQVSVKLITVLNALEGFGLAPTGINSRLVHMARIASEMRCHAAKSLVVVQAEHQIGHGCRVRQHMMREVMATRIHAGCQWPS